MSVRQWMTTDVVSTTEKASIQEALALMKRHSIRHLPVVDETQRLVGWVTDADLRGVLIASMLEDLTVADVMVRQPYLVRPHDSLEKAASLILSQRIGGLPVVDGARLVGVITVVDILSAFISLLGIMEQSSRLDVKMGGAKTTLEEVTRLLHGSGAEIISVCYLRPFEDQHPIYSFRLKKCDLAPIVAKLKDHEVEVVSSES